MEVCSYCGEKAFDTEEQVCIACGDVDGTPQITSNGCPDLTFKSFDYNFQKRKVTSLNHGIETLDHLCHVFNIQQNVKLVATTLLKSIYANHRKSKRSFKYKDDVGVLAGCCLIHSQKKHGSIISIRNICSTLKCNIKKVAKMLKLLKCYISEHENNTDDNVDFNAKVKKEDNNAVILTSYVTSLLCKFPTEIKGELIEKTISLSKLAQSLWLTTGRSISGVVTAAAYLCWKSICPHDKSPFPEFCSNYQLNVSKSRSRVPELKQMLMKLGANIPTVTKNYVNKKNILYHLNYILENSESLRNDLLTNEHTKEDMNKKEFNTYRKCYLKKKVVCTEVSAYDENMNASDVEISDSEITSYLRTDEQIKVVQTLNSL